MKQIYILTSSYWNGCDVFENIYAVYADEDTAVFEQLRLEEENTDSGQSYFVTAWELL